MSHIVGKQPLNHGLGPEGNMVPGQVENQNVNFTKTLGGGTKFRPQLAVPTNNVNNRMRGTTASGFGAGLGTGGEFHQSQSQFSEFDDNLSSVIINYDNLTGFINNQGNQGRGANVARGGLAAYRGGRPGIQNHYGNGAAGMNHQDNGRHVSLAAIQNERGGPGAGGGLAGPLNGGGAHGFQNPNFAIGNENLNFDSSG